MKISSLFAIVILIISGCHSHPDDIVPLINNLDLRRILVSEYDVNSDGKLTPDEVSQIKELNIHRTEDSRLLGLEYLDGLENFYCTADNLDYILLHENKNLEKAELRFMKNLKRVFVNKNLQELIISEAKNLESLKLESMPFLHTLIVAAPIKEFSTGECPSLTWLTIDCENIDKLDLSLYPRLESLYIQNPNFTELDLSMLPNLRDVRCKGVSRIVLAPGQKIDGVNIEPDYRNCIDESTQIITK